MVETIENTGFNRVMIATQSHDKRHASQATIQEINQAFNVSVPVDSFNPEYFKPESDGDQVDLVADEKNETLIQNIPFADGERVLMVAFDVVTLIGSDQELNEGQGFDLKRILRQLDLSGDKDATAKWQHIMEVLDAEQTRMIERCTNGAFCIEWHVGFSIKSNDYKISNRAALVLRATFNALSPDIVMQAFALSDDLQAMKEKGEVPTENQLVKGVQAFAIGPRLPFVEMLQDHADTSALTIQNRDYPEVTPDTTTVDRFKDLVKNCALPAHVCLQLLANSYDPEATATSVLEKPTVLLTQVS